MNHDGDSLKSNEAEGHEDMTYCDECSDAKWQVEFDECELKSGTHVRLLAVSTNRWLHSNMPNYNDGKYWSWGGKPGNDMDFSFIYDGELDSNTEVWIRSNNVDKYWSSQPGHDEHQEWHSDTADATVWNIVNPDKQGELLAVPWSFYSSL